MSPRLTVQFAPFVAHGFDGRHCVNRIVLRLPLRRDISVAQVQGQLTTLLAARSALLVFTASLTRMLVFESSAASAIAVRGVVALTMTAGLQEKRRAMLRITSWKAKTSLFSSSHEHQASLYELAFTTTISSDLASPGEVGASASNPTQPPPSSGATCSPAVACAAATTTAAPVDPTDKGVGKGVVAERWVVAQYLGDAAVRDLSTTDATLRPLQLRPLTAVACALGSDSHPCAVAGALFVGTPLISIGHLPVLLAAPALMLDNGRPATSPWNSALLQSAAQPYGSVIQYVLERVPGVEAYECWPDARLIQPAAPYLQPLFASLYQSLLKLTVGCPSRWACWVYALHCTECIVLHNSMNTDTILLHCAYCIAFIALRCMHCICMSAEYRCTSYPRYFLKPTAAAACSVTVIM